MSRKTSEGVSNRAALDPFLREVQGRALTAARLSVPDDDALDCVQDAMLAFVCAYSGRPRDQWRPLFFRILYNKLRDWHRRRAVRQAVLWVTGREDDSPSPLPDPQRWLAAQDAGARLVAELERLPLRQQQAFVLRHWEGMDTETTAGAMGVNAGTVKTHLSRATERLRQVLEGHHEHR